MFSLQTLLIASDPRFGRRVNPQAHRAEALVERFAQARGIHLPGLKLVNTMAGYLYPQASLPHLELICTVMFLLFYVDDVYGDTPGMQGISGAHDDDVSMLEACADAFVFGSSERKDPLVTAFAEMHHAIRRRSPGHWFLRLTNAMYDHLISTATPGIYGWEPGQRPTSDQYVYVRERVSGMYPTVDLLEFASERYLTPAQIAHPVTQRLRLTTARVGCLTNDLFSYEKEVAQNGLLLNLVAVLQQRMPFEHAVASAMAYINDQTRDFLDAAKDADGLLPPFYLEGLKYQLAATWFWQMSTNRYRSATSPFVELRTPVSAAPMR